jgi:D-alanyl-lipoteichoic acid acyltransferase DltB (MBOAT superfamily)
VTFTTLTFTLFFAVVFALYWSVRQRRLQNALLLVASYVFYLSWDYRFCAILLASSLIDYGVGRGLEKFNRLSSRRALLGISLAWNIGMLCFFKYANFFLENFRALTQAIGWRVNPPLLKIILPIGVSFYTFKTLTYTIDVYRRQLKATPHVIEYLTYVAFFPQLLAGPIDRAANLLPQLSSERQFNYPVAVDGCRQILWGFVKKTALADNLSPIVSHAYASPATTAGPHLMLATICFAFQIYCDFSAYTDIAIGTTKLLGFSSMRNFAYPYFSQSMAEFWRRWHISLTSWFRDYVYFSLGGVRGTLPRRAANVVITFLLSGLWHGASWNFLIWGGLNGLAIVPEMFRKKRKAAGAEKVLPAPGVLLKILVTFGITCLIWVFFRAATLSQAVMVYKRMLFDLANIQAYRHPGLILAYSPIGYVVFLFLFVFIGMEWLHRHHEHPLTLDSWPRPLRWAAYTGLIAIAFRYGFQATGQFVYFRF